MKKIIISIATISVFIFTSCFTDTDTATVKINLGNLPVAKTAKVEKKSIIDRFLMFFAKEAIAQPSDVMVIHLGAFDANNQLLAKKSVTAMWEGEPVEVNTVEFDVPAGIRRKIVVLGEEKDPDGENENWIGYYGVSDEINLIAGEVVPVDIIVQALTQNYIGLKNGDWVTDEPATWEPIPGASKYNIYNDYSPFDLIASVTKTEYLGTSSGWHNLRVYFDFAKMESSDFSFDIYQC